MIHTELTPDVHQTLSDEIFWMMTHRESEFMKFAQKLRDNIRKKWNKLEEIIPLPAPDEEVIIQLRDCGERLLEFRYFFIYFLRYLLFSSAPKESPNNSHWLKLIIFGLWIRQNLSSVQCTTLLTVKKFRISRKQLITSITCHIGPKE